MRVELKRLHREMGRTTIYVTHDQLEGMTMADRIGVMNYGVLQQYDDPHTLFNKPKNLFVAGFIGTPTMNFLECEYEERDGKALLIFNSFSLDVSKYKEVIDKGKRSSSMILGVRPSDITVQKERGNEDQFVEAKVDIIELTGDEKILDLDIGGDIVRAIAKRRFPVEVGEKVWLRLDLDRLHIFDKKTEEAIL
jgi:multiple sugar transport system ATP-binding protein